ncbi:MlaD family protein [Tsukamurella sp. 8F]|uniref:MlaD family protein n=1 Tax=unclassified Tsukamurella TaxID=2633480 RepID=UPI0023B9A018|nr:MULTISPECIES: MlaD family protein [unclassified Tsukamurella]MDF0530305.1 MlaD family protein [Tsukamurella sp. 8J]MDF0587602.1 MlaD family protein [Tsukamurella sp. 8F]
MQSKMKIFNRPMPTAAQDKRQQLNWGIAGIIIVVILGLIAGYLAFFQPGKKEYTAWFEEAQTVQKGDAVRVAGITVGSVASTKLESDHVVVKFKVNNDIFVGDASQLATRMLTVVGGYYLALTPMGDQPLGDKPIPWSRITTPYSLMETFQKATPKVGKIDATPVRQSLAQLNQAITDQPDSIRNTVGTMNKMVDNIVRQQDQAGEFIKIMGQYSEAVRDNGDLLVSLMHNMSTFFASANANLAGFHSYLDNLAELVQRLVPLENVYLRDVVPLASRLDGLLAKARELIKQAQPAINQGKDMLKQLQTKIEPNGSITVDQSSQRFLATNVCIPSPGVNC